MEQMANTGEMTVSAEKLEEVKRIFSAVAVSEEQTLEQIRETRAGNDYILDPHTAVGVKAAKPYPGTVCLATAHPAKFGDAVKKAIGIEAPPPASLQGLMEKETRCQRLPAETQAIKRYIETTLGKGFPKANG